jgi:hypothetical protein
MYTLKDRFAAFLAQNNVRSFLGSCFYLIFIYVFFFHSTEKGILDMQFMGSLLEVQKEKHGMYPKALDEVFSEGKSEHYEYSVTDTSIILISKNMDNIRFENGIFSSNNYFTKAYLFLRSNFGLIASSSASTLLSVCMLLWLIAPRFLAQKVTKS